MKIKKYFLNRKGNKVSKSEFELTYILLSSFDDENSAQERAEKVKSRTGVDYEIYIIEIDIYPSYKDV